MMVPRAFAQNPLAQRRHTLDLDEKDNLPRANGRHPSSGLPARFTLPQCHSPRRSTTLAQAGLVSQSDPVKIPPRSDKAAASLVRRPGPLSLQNPRSLPAAQSALELPRRKTSVQDLLSSTTIPVRRKPRPRPAQRLPNCDYVADFSKLLREDVQAAREGSLSGSWTSPQFEGLFGNIDGLVEEQMIVGSDSLDPGMLTTRSISSESMPSLSSPDDFSANEMASLSPATVRSPSDHRLRQMAHSEDCSDEHPLLPGLDVDDASGAATPEWPLSPSLARPRRTPAPPEKKPNSFKSSLTASLKALKSAAQTVSNIATTPPLVQPDEFLTKSIFDFQPSLTDDRRPPPSDKPPSPALRRYLNPHISAPPDSPAQLHFWLDDKTVTPPHETKPKPKIRRKYHQQRSAPARDDKPRAAKGPRRVLTQLPPIVPLATCIPSAVRTAHASSPPTWLEPDGTPSNKHRAAQTLLDAPDDGPKGDSQPRPREPRENRDFLRIFVCEMNMRKNGKLSDDAVGHARLWLPPVEETDSDKDRRAGLALNRKSGIDRWQGWSIDDL